MTAPARPINLNDYAALIDLELMRMLWIVHWASPHQLCRLVLGTATRTHRERINKVLLRLFDSAKLWREPRETNRTATDNREHFDAARSGGFCYGLTDVGEAFMRDQALPLMPELRESHCLTREFMLTMAARNTMRHSGHYTEFCTQFLAEMRHHPLTLGIFLDTECTRLGSHLRMDGLLRHRFSSVPRDGAPGDETPLPWHVPWLHGLRTPDAPGIIDRTYAIEIDEGTEPLDIIVRKAENYKRTFLGGMDVRGVTPVPWDTVLCPAGERLPPEIRQRYFPLPVFIAPGAQRMVNIWAAWQAGWAGSGFRATHWGIINAFESVVHAPYLNQRGEWVNLLGQPHAYQGRLPKPYRIPSKSAGQPA